MAASIAVAAALLIRACCHLAAVQQMPVVRACPALACSAILPGRLKIEAATMRSLGFGSPAKFIVRCAPVRWLRAFTATSENGWFWTSARVMAWRSAEQGKPPEQPVERLYF